MEHLIGGKEEAEVLAENALPPEKSPSDVEEVLERLNLVSFVRSLRRLHDNYGTGKRSEFDR